MTDIEKELKDAEFFRIKCDKCLQEYDQRDVSAVWHHTFYCSVRDIQLPPAINNPALPIVELPEERSVATAAPPLQNVGEQLAYIRGKSHLIHELRLALLDDISVVTFLNEQYDKLMAELKNIKIQ